MDFQFTEEQQQFADALKRWAAKDYAFETRQKIVLSEAGGSDEAWATLVELGMTALPVPEEQGGFNGSAVDLYVVMQELGRALVVEPYLATVLGAHCLQLGGAHADLLAQVAAGELRLACALGEPQARHDMRDIATTAIAEGDGYVLNGRKSVVIHGAQAGMLIVSARSHGGQSETDGISLFVVPADAQGVHITQYRTVDGQRAADILLKDVNVPAAHLIGPAGQGWAVLDAALDYGAGLLCAEAIGALQALFDATLEYLKTRQQFGVPIGKFQALQHRMADMYIHLEQARSMALLAAVKLASENVEERRRAVSAAKYRVGQAIRFVGQQAIQLHGGMGVTNELPAAHYFKRLTMIELTLGDSDHHLQRFIAHADYSSHSSMQ
ncbi:pimeloyl-CoA dehydrogenase small subunit [Massilia arenosa]|uniref:Pimeloyl-CoA dehydrogenase small subunit n=1 Tax=Zemynaea arenosa TaxID=2561931 RepID=A0A4Y9SFZ2_9BURK|nr:acyl-CoA dehydrogenase family protein [Massilia arenosa]TFW22464.1 pimeloyl-CoA dehydrogenase small subunit [Massilia arenosa]